MPTAVLLIAHGSRRPAANADLLRLADILRADGHYPQVEAAFLEIAEPTIPAAAAAAVTRGADRVLMLPYFLAAGEHVVRDLEMHRQSLAASYPNCSFVLCPPLGLHPLLVDVVRERLRDGEADRPTGTT